MSLPAPLDGSGVAPSDTAAKQPCRATRCCERIGGSQNKAPVHDLVGKMKKN